MKRPLCVHCKRRVQKSRGLCWSCFRNPDVRLRIDYPSEWARLSATRSRAPDVSSSPLPLEPTHTEPGSDERIEVLSERVMRGESVSHPDDATLGATREWEVPTATNHFWERR